MDNVHDYLHSDWHSTADDDGVPEARDDKADEL